MLNVMIDLETLGTKPGCKILSIGACTFLTDTPAYFHQVVDVDSQNGNFFTDQSTVDWWMKTNPKMYNELLTEETRLPIQAAITQFTLWLTELKDYDFKTCKVWGNSASFDLKILEFFYAYFSLQPPWKYNNEMCYRTLKNLYPHIKIGANTNAHNALSDAVAQARHAVDILLNLNIPYANL